MCITDMFYQVREMAGKLGPALQVGESLMWQNQQATTSTARPPAPETNQSRPTSNTPVIESKPKSQVIQSRPNTQVIESKPKPQVIQSTTQVIQSTPQSKSTPSTSAPPPPYEEAIRPPLGKLPQLEATGPIGASRLPPISGSMKESSTKRASALEPL